MGRRCSCSSALARGRRRAGTYCMSLYCLLLLLLVPLARPSPACHAVSPAGSAAGLRVSPCSRLVPSAFRTSGDAMPPECRGHEAPSLAFVSHRGVPDARQCLSYDKKQGVEQLCIARVPSGGADESASSPHRASIALSKLRLGIAMAGLVPVSGLLRVGIGACFLLSLLARAKGSLAYTPVPMLSSPFFDGWFVRLTDLEQGLSCAVIVGSLRHSGAREFSQHYIALSYSAASMARRGASSPDELQSVHVFPDPRDVKITLDGCEMKGFLGEADWRSPAAGRRSLKWSSASHGFIQISGSCTRVDFTLPGSHGESVSLRADLGEIQPWGASRAAEDGPEGWLGKVGFMLPCRYFVQSLASRTTYSLRRSRTRAPADAAAAPGASPAAAAAAGAQWHRVDTALSGMALSHVETNYGAAFPSGWIYIQGVGRDGVSVLVTGGEFGIGPVAPLTYIVAVRGPGGQRWDFRTTDASVVKVSFSCEQRVVRLVARSVLGYGRVDLLVRDGAKKHDEQAVWVPMRTGFSCQPGCSESFGAAARIMAWGPEVKWQSGDQPPSAPPALDCELSSVALEFGGNFQSPRPEMQASMPASRLW